MGIESLLPSSFDISFSLNYLEYLLPIRGVTFQRGKPRFWNSRNQRTQAPRSKAGEIFNFSTSRRESLGNFIHSQQLPCTPSPCGRDRANEIRYRDVIAAIHFIPDRTSPLYACTYVSPPFFLQFPSSFPFSRAFFLPFFLFFFANVGSNERLQRGRILKFVSSNDIP